jgi:YGGT family
VLDWTAVLASGGRGLTRVREISDRVTEPVIGPVRRVLPQMRVGDLRIDLAFTVVLIANRDPALAGVLPLITSGPASARGRAPLLTPRGPPSLDPWPWLGEPPSPLRDRGISSSAPSIDRPTAALATAARGRA